MDDSQGGPDDPTGSVERCLFISYAHADADYAVRLSALLEREGLPCWYDGHLGWGSRFTVEIRERIRTALGVIVLMSSAAHMSEWVEREILEAQSRDRPLLPILLEGERLFLLAATHFFDAREGALPGERELAELHRLVMHRDRDATLQLPAPRAGAPVAAATVDDVSLLKLRDLLAQGDLTHADILTTSLLLGAAGRLDQGWMTVEDGERLPFDVLLAIDRAWSTHTAGRFGLRAQLGRQPGGGDWLVGYRGFSTLATALGWRLPDRRVMPRYSEFVPGEPPPGFFPTLRNPQLESRPRWHDRWRLTAMAVHRRVHQWEAQG